jgi:hypothetical protein
MLCRVASCRLCADLCVCVCQNIKIVGHVQRGDTFILLAEVEDAPESQGNCSTAQESRLIEVRMVKGGGIDSCWCCSFIFLLGDDEWGVTDSISSKVRLCVSSSGRSEYWYPKPPTSRGAPSGVCAGL